jgi:hypothetical protein
MRIAIGPAGTPEWHLCSFVREAAAAAGIALEAKRFDGGEARRVASVHEGMAEVSVALPTTAGAILPCERSPRSITPSGSA